MSAIGTKRTFSLCPLMPTFGGKADVALKPEMSANDPKRTIYSAAINFPDSA
jgi:hypothetical protein